MSITLYRIECKRCTNGPFTCTSCDEGIMAAYCQGTFRRFHLTDDYYEPGDMPGPMDEFGRWMDLHERCGAPDLRTLAELFYGSYDVMAYRGHHVVSFQVRHADIGRDSGQAIYSTHDVLDLPLVLGPTTLLRNYAPVRELVGA